MVPVTLDFRHPRDLGGKIAEGLLEEFFLFLTFQKKKHTFELSLFHQHSKFHVSVAWPALVTSIKEVLAVRVCLALCGHSPSKGKSDLKVVSKVQSLERFL